MSDHNLSAYIICFLTAGTSDMLWHYNQCAHDIWFLNITLKVWDMCMIVWTTKNRYLKCGGLVSVWYHKQALALFVLQNYYPTLLNYTRPASLELFISVSLDQDNRLKNSAYVSNHGWDLLLPYSEQPRLTYLLCSSQSSHKLHMTQSLLKNTTYTLQVQIPDVFFTHSQTGHKPPQLLSLL